MWIILKKDDELFKMINTDVCACFQNVNGGLGFEHGNYSRVVPTTDIADVQDILDYIAYCLKQKKYICEVPSKDYEDWKSRLYTSEKDLKKLIEEVNRASVMPIPIEEGYIATYHGVPIEELQKAYFIQKNKERMDKYAKVGFINPISPEEIKKIKEQEEKKKLKELERSVRNIIDTNITIRCPHCDRIVAEDNKDVIIKNFINDSSPISCPYCEKIITKEDKIKAVEVVVEWYKNFKLTELSQEEKNYLDNYINSIPHYDD